MKTTAEDDDDDDEREVKRCERRMGLLLPSLSLSVVSSVLRWPAANLCQCQHEAFPKQTCVSNLGPSLTGVHTCYAIGLEKSHMWRFHT